MRELGIIGFGHFGRFAATHVKEKFDVTVFDATDVSQEAEALGVRFGSLSDAASKPFVLFAVPVQALEQSLKEANAFIRPGALVLDVSSVKVLPCQWMAGIFPESVDVVGTHPLFGPQSGKDGIAGFRIAVCPARVSKTRLDVLCAFLEDEFGLQVVRVSPEEHDRSMAGSQVLAHFVGKALLEMDAPKTGLPLATTTHLLSLRDLIAEDSDALFRTIQEQNPFAKQARKRFLAELARLDSLLD